MEDASMSTSVSTQRASSPSDQLRGQLAAMSDQFRSALPSHIKPEKFQRVVMTVVQQQPDLLAADRRALLASCMRCAADGLVPDGREAALVIFNTKKKDAEGRDQWIKAVQYMPMLTGVLKRVRNSGELAGVTAEIIYENDEFIRQPDDFDHPIRHRPAKLGTPRGAAIGAYALAKLKDGTLMSEVMDITDINKVAAVSRSRDKAGNPYGPWKDWWDEMAKKTVFRRLSKWLPMDAESDQILSRDDEPVDQHTIEGNVVPIEAPRTTSKLDALEDMTVDAEPEASGPPLSEQIQKCTDYHVYQQTLEPAANAQLDAGMSIEESKELEAAMEAAAKRFQHPTVAGKK